MVARAVCGGGAVPGGISTGVGPDGCGESQDFVSWIGGWWDDGIVDMYEEGG